MTYNSQYGKKFDVIADTASITAKNGITLDAGTSNITVSSPIAQTGNQTITGNLTVTGNILGTGAITRTGAATLTGNLAVVTGNITQSGGSAGITGDTYVVTGGLEFTPSQTSQTFTNAAGSARTDAGTGLTAQLFKRGAGAGKLVEVVFELGNLATPANSVAAAAMTFNETLPATYRPAVTMTGILGVRENAAEGTGSWEISTAGVVRIFGSLNQNVFTNGASCAIRSSFTTAYRSIS